MINPKDYIITKSSGEQEKFNEEKLHKHLKNVGVNPPLAEEAITDLENNLSKINSTDAIYHNISEFLRHHGTIDNYFNYSLRRAVAMLGPSGHPFEQLVSEVLNTQGFRTEVGVTVLGKCVTHEIDVVAAKENTQYFIECKFHNTTGTKTDIQVALYTYARFLDVKSAMEQTHGQEKNYLPWLVTNTKVTSEVFDYGDCNNLKVTAWYYPEGEGLRDMIMTSKLHPVTLLYHISPHKINTLLNENIVTLSSLQEAIKKDRVSHILNNQEIDHIKEDLKYLYQ